MVIIVTGAIGIGKTTVCQKVVSLARNLGYSCGGILTYKALDEGIIIEDIQSGEKETLASSENAYSGPRTGKYFFNPAGIEFGIRAINRGISCDTLFVDEIGYLELRGEGFTKVFEVVRDDRAKDIIIVIRSELLPSFLPQLPETPLIFKTTTNNREELPQEISSVLLKELS